MSQSINPDTGVGVKLEVESSRGSQVIIVSRDKGRRLADILRHEHLSLNTRCGQRGLCDGCIVELVAGSLVRVATGEVKLAGGPSLAEGLTPAARAHLNTRRSLSRPSAVSARSASGCPGPAFSAIA